ncbi:hypothetical protein BX285_6570 [Streptomyces sp. 1114.5]|nr:hypothetical protein BX285_6570 [Streptomyces sp. 1114.5]
MLFLHPFPDLGTGSVAAPGERADTLVVVRGVRP